MYNLLNITTFTNSLIQISSTKLASKISCMLPVNYGHTYYKTWHDNRTSANVRPTFSFPFHFFFLSSTCKTERKEKNQHLKITDDFFSFFLFYFMISLLRLVYHLREKKCSFFFLFFFFLCVWGRIGKLRSSLSSGPLPITSVWVKITLICQRSFINCHGE